jgi:serpin B
MSLEKKVFVIILLALYWLFISAENCAAQDNGNANLNAVVEANTRFGFGLFSNLVKEDHRRNIFISPASISLALSMTYNGAQGSTRQKMAQTLGLDSITIENVNQAYRTLIPALMNADTSVQLSIANSLWAKKEITFKPDFLNLVHTNYEAEIASLDFDDPASVVTINNWVNEHTRGKIKSILDKIEKDAILFLINAIYFKGNWAAKFNEKATQEKDFTLISQARKKVQMMFHAGRYRYLKGKNFQAVSIPYGKDRFSMYIFLPDSGVELSKFYGDDLIPNGGGWISDFNYMDGDIYLPRFKIENDFMLTDHLKSMGMAEAFDSAHANFHALCELGQEQNAFISFVRHKTFIEVNEKGTEAAAVTAVGIVITSAYHSSEPHFIMIVDRPFFCAIRDNETGMLLFMGSIVDPQ